eukprot:TRINITY_DN11428_c0_g1_i1.p1 TRINITY_DN11428_c0_g1~~TRINITY_DN11428_c0_g1_i1.p1  ORF type:complete len:311 (+),score=82.74 TRINITY_DN11428_c0_g1_i1:43-975(+)
MEDQVQMLVAMFPDFQENVIRAAVKKGGNADAAAELLLTGFTIEDDKKNQDSLDPDVELAKRLQLELDMETITGIPPENQRALTQEEQDELFARSLMEDDRRQSRSRTSYSNADFERPAISFSNVDPNVANELLNQTKSMIIPLLLKELQGFKAPDIEEDLDNSISISVKEIAMSEVKVPEENISLKLVGENIQLSVSDISAKLNQFSWGYKKNSFPKISDSGKGDAGISQVKIEALMSIGGLNGSAVVHSCTVNIGHLDLKISGTAMSLIYNMVISAFKNTIKTSIEKALANMITNSMDASSKAFEDGF